MRDPGLSLQSTTLDAAWRLLPGQHESAAAYDGDATLDAADAIDDLADAAHWRARRVLLDADWWRHAGAPMIARVAERRRMPRGATPLASPSLAAGTGWVALVPGLRGWTMRARDADDVAIEWKVDASVAARLSPFAFTFHERLPARALGARYLLAFALRHGGRDLALLLIAGFAASIVGLFTPAATGWLVDHAIPAGALQQVQAIVAGLAVAGASVVALDLFRSLAIARFESRIGASMQAALVDRVLSAPPRFVRDYASGDLAMRMGSVNTVQRTLTGSTIGTLVTSLFLLSNLALMIAYSPALTLASMAVVAAIVAISTALGLARLEVGPRIEALDGKLAAMQFEMFSAIAKLRAAAAEPRALEHWYARYDELRNESRRAARLTNWESVALSLLWPAATLMVLMLAWRAPAVASLSTGRFVAFHAALFAMLAGVHQLVSTAIDVVNLKPVWDRARPILETPPEDSGIARMRHEPGGAIELRGVSFAYPGSGDVLRGIDLAIRPGEFVAIVGPSGSGKSTLLRLLLGFERPREGHIRFDGLDLATLDLRRLRRRIGTVLQNGKLWAGDLLSNIAGANNASPEAAWEAVKLAGLDRDIEAMPLGLYTMVGEGLSTLSGGQRQRVMIARALMGKPRIVLLDEATSALDNLSQAHVLARLGESNATRVVIAHRLSTVRDADRIVVLERGRIVEQGSFEQLAARQGRFAAMLSRQVA
jgi:ATP-binding cassette subfamily C protein